VFLGGDIAEHSGAVPADVGCPDAGGDVVVGGGDIGDERTQGIEGGLEAVLELLVHVLFDHMQGDMTRALDHDLYLVPPGDPGQLAEGLQLRELGLVVGVRDGAGAQAVAQTEGDVIGLHDLADVFEMGVEKTLLVVGETPLGHDGTTAGDDAGDPFRGQGHMAQQHAGMDGEVIHPLLGLFDKGIAEQLPGQFLGLALDLLQGLIEGYSADGYGGVAQDPLPGLVDVAAGGQIHQGIAAPTGGPDHLFHLFGDG